MMLGLNFEVAKSMIAETALTGGIMFICLQYSITKLTMRKTIVFANSTPY